MATPSEQRTDGMPPALQLESYTNFRDNPELIADATYRLLENTKTREQVQQLGGFCLDLVDQFSTSDRATLAVKKISHAPGNKELKPNAVFKRSQFIGITRVMETSGVEIRVGTSGQQPTKSIKLRRAKLRLDAILDHDENDLLAQAVAEAAHKVGSLRVSYAYALLPIQADEPDREYPDINISQTPGEGDKLRFIAVCHVDSPADNTTGEPTRRRFAMYATTPVGGEQGLGLLRGLKTVHQRRRQEDSPTVRSLSRPRTRRSAPRVH